MLTACLLACSDAHAVVQRAQGPGGAREAAQARQSAHFRLAHPQSTPPGVRHVRTCPIQNQRCAAAAKARRLQSTQPAVVCMLHSTPVLRSRSNGQAVPGERPKRSKVLWKHPPSDHEPEPWLLDALQNGRWGSWGCVGGRPCMRACSASMCAQQYTHTHISPPCSCSCTLRQHEIVALLSSPVVDVSSLVYKVKWTMQPVTPPIWGHC